MYKYKYQLLINSCVTGKLATLITSIVTYSANFGGQRYCIRSPLMNSNFYTNSYF